MKNQLMFFILLIALLAGCKKDKGTDNPTSPVYHTFEGGIGAYDNSTIVTSDNNLAICGQLNNGNYFLLKISKAGNLIWRKDFSAGQYTHASALVETADHDFLIVGTIRYGFPATDWDVILVKTNSTGDVIWTKTYGSDKVVDGHYIMKTNDNNYLIAANTNASDTDTSDIYLIKINADGDTLWTKYYQKPDYEIPNHILQTQNGEYLVTGRTYDVDPIFGLYFLKVDANGNKLWDKTIGAGTRRWGLSTIELAGGDLVTCGAHGSSNGYSQALLVKTDHVGNEYWEKEFGNFQFQAICTSIKPDADGSLTMTGTALESSDDILLLKVDQNGNQIWYKKFGGPDWDDGVNLIKDTNGDNIITGTIMHVGTNTSIRNIFMTRVDDNGNFK